GGERGALRLAPGMGRAGTRCGPPPPAAPAGTRPAAAGALKLPGMRLAARPPRRQGGRPLEPGQSASILLATSTTPPPMSTRADQIRQALAALQPLHLEVLDESHMHSRGLETHYKAVIVSEAFAGKRPVQRHQAVYAAMGGLMQQIHALALHTYTPA